MQKVSIKKWHGLLRNEWHGLLRNHWHGLLRNEWHGIVRNSHHFGCIYLATCYTNKGGEYLKGQSLILDSFDECDKQELVHYFTVRKYPSYP